MPSTTGYQAGFEANNVAFAYAVEAIWGTAPSVAFQQIRAMSDSLSATKKRDRPTELNTTGVSSAAITTQVTAGGQIMGALSYGTYDDFLASAVKGSWQAPVSIAGAAGDISATASPQTLTSTTAGKFTGIGAGQYIRTFGFTTPANNGVFRVTAATGTTLTLAGGALVNETPAGTAAQIRASTLVNGNAVSSLFIQKQFSPSVFLQYPGSFVNDAEITGGTGKFLEAHFTLLSQNELSATSNASTGSVLPATTGRVNDPVGGFKGVFFNDTLLTAVADSFTAKVTSTGAAQEFGLGSAAAQGFIAGLLTVSGDVKTYFKDFSLYQVFAQETTGNLAFVSADPAGNIYVVSIPVCNLMNPKVVAGGQNQAVMADFTIEGNPDPNGRVIRVDRLSAT